MRDSHEVINKTDGLIAIRKATFGVKQMILASQTQSVLSKLYFETRPIPTI